MKVSKDVVYRCVAGEHMLIPVGSASLGKSGMYVLTEVGGEIWKLLSADKSFDEIVAAILEEYDADEQTVRKDTVTLIEKLQEAGLVTE